MINYVIEKIDKIYHRPKISKFFKNKNVETFIDVGGFKGLYSDIFLKDSKKIIIFEPQLKYFKFLMNKYKKNKKVFVINNALGKKNILSKININFLESTSSLSQINNTSKWYKFKKIIFYNKLIKEKQKIRIIKLDSIKKVSQIKDISLIKIDTEGYEMNILLGAQKTLKKTKFLLIELHNNKMYKNYDKIEIKNFLIQNNFVFIKKFKFPFIPFSDHVYMNLKFNKKLWIFKLSIYIFCDNY